MVAAVGDHRWSRHLVARHRGDRPSCARVLLVSAHAKSLGTRDGTSYADRARTRWAGKAPDWVLALAAEADRSRAEGLSQGDLGKRLGLAGSVISAVIGKTYP